MNAVTYSQARQDLAKTMDKVCDDHSPVIITRKSRRSVVMISLEDYQALEETAYLLRGPKNAQRLLESIVELESGGGRERELIECRSSSPRMPGMITSTGNGLTERSWSASTGWLRKYNAQPLKELASLSPSDMVCLDIGPVVLPMNTGSCTKSIRTPFILHSSDTTIDPGLLLMT
jgi:antitoxin YefM